MSDKDKKNFEFPKEIFTNTQKVEFLKKMQAAHDASIARINLNQSASIPNKETK